MSLLSRLARFFWDSSPPRPSAADEPPAQQALAREQPAEPEPEERLAAWTRSTQLLGPEECAQLGALVEQLVSRGEERRAADLLRSAGERLPPTSGLQLRLAELLAALREFVPCVELLERLVQAAPQQLDAHFLLAEAYAQLGHAAEAQAHYEAVLALDFTHPRARGRADELRRQANRPALAADATVLGAEDLGPGSRFVLQRELGRGGGGTVYLARDEQLGREVAVKVLHRQAREQQQARIQLFCEARIAAAIRHPQIVTIYDLDEELNLVVMEHCAGGALAAQIAAAPLSPLLALRRLVEITTVLETVHRCGVIHRDLKPANLLLRGGQDAMLVLTDFGSAHMGQKDAQSLAAAGSLAYMAPEQREESELGPSADLYACGVILLEMLLGHAPLTAQQAIAGTPLLARDELWSELAACLPRCLAPALLALCQSLVDPIAARRPQEAAEVTTRARALIALGEEWGLQQAVLAELRQRAGAPPRPPAVQQWLDEQVAARGGD